MTLLRRLAIGALALAAVVVGTFWWIGHRAVDRVTVATGVPQCEGTTLSTRKDHVDGFVRQAIPLTKGFTCVLNIRVVNGSERAVRLGEVTFPISGPGGGGGFRVTHVGHDAVPDGSEIDVVADLDRSLQPGEEDLVNVRVVFRKAGCTSRGFTWFNPTLAVSALLSTVELRIADFPVFAGTTDSSCDT